MAKVRKSEVEKKGNSAQTGASVNALIDRIAKDIPPEAWDELPRDLSQHFDEYESGERPWPK